MARGEFLMSDMNTFQSSEYCNFPGLVFVISAVSCDSDVQRLLMHQGNQILEWEWGRSKCSVSSFSAPGRNTRKISKVFFILLYFITHIYFLTPGRVLQVLWQLGDRTAASKKCTVISLSMWRGCLLMCVLELQQSLKHGPSFCSLVAQCQIPQEPMSITVVFMCEVCHQNRH